MISKKKGSPKETINLDFRLEKLSHEWPQVTTHTNLFRLLLIPREIALLLTAIVLTFLLY